MHLRSVRSSTLCIVGAAVVLVSLSAPTAAQPPEPVRILIGFDHAPGPAEEALVHAEGGRIRYRYQLVPAMAVTVPETALEGLLHNPHVTVVEMDGVAYAIDAELDHAWGVNRIGAGSAHAGGNLGTGVAVAIVDTGIDCTHPDLNGNCVVPTEMFCSPSRTPRRDAIRHPSLALPPTVCNGMARVRPTDTVSSVLELRARVVAPST